MSSRTTITIGGFWTYQQAINDLFAQTKEITINNIPTHVNEIYRKKYG